MSELQLPPASSGYEYNLPQIVQFDQAIAERFCEEYASGKTWAQIMVMDGMPSESTIRGWLARYPAFTAAFMMARERKADKLIDEAFEIADDTSRDWKEDSKGRLIPDWENVNRSKLRVETRKWAAGRLAPLKWGDKIHVDGTVNVTHLEETLNDRLKRVHDILAEFESRGGKPDELLGLIGITPKQIERMEARDANRIRMATEKSKKAVRKPPKEKPKNAQFKDIPPVDDSGFGLPPGSGYVAPPPSDSAVQGDSPVDDAQ